MLKRNLVIASVLLLPLSACVEADAPEPDEDALATLGQEVVGDCTVTLTMSPTSPQSAGTAVVGTAEATCIDGTPEYAFYRRGPDLKWSLVQAYSGDNTLDWDTTTAITGDYVIQAWARRSGQTLSYEGASPARTYTIENGNSSCYSPTFVSSPSSPQPPGTTISLTPSSTCTPGATAEYKYYVRNPANQWSVLQDWTTSPANWSTTGLATGSYRLQVWSRAVGSTATFQGASAVATYSLTSPACTGAILYTPTPTSPRPIGTQVNVSGLGTCPEGSTAEYRFWIRRPDGTWFALGAYSTTPSATWDTTGAAAGTYTLQAWVRRVGNTGTYDVASTLKSYVLQ